MKDDALWYEAAQVVGVTNALNVVADALGAGTPGLPALDPAAAPDEARALFDEVRAFYHAAEVPLPFRLMAHDPAYARDVWGAVRRAFGDTMARFGGFFFTPSRYATRPVRSSGGTAPARISRIVGRRNRSCGKCSKRSAGQRLISAGSSTRFRRMPGARCRTGQVTSTTGADHSIAHRLLRPRKARR